MIVDSAARHLGELLNRLNVPWTVIGGHAANVYRDEIRHTGDVDILVSLGATSMKDVLRELVLEGWELVRTVEDDWMARVHHPEHGLADIIASGLEYQEIALARSHHARQEDGFVVNYMTVEDIIIHKLIANRHKDDSDVMSILATRPALDTDYLDRWIAEWEVGDRYEALRARMAEDS